MKSPVECRHQHNATKAELNPGPGKPVYVISSVSQIKPLSVGYGALRVGQSMGYYRTQGARADALARDYIPERKIHPQICTHPLLQEGTVCICAVRERERGLRSLEKAC